MDRESSTSFALRSRRVLAGSDLVPATVIVKEGKIFSVTDYKVSPLNIPIEDLGDCVVMPGLVDTHVHINEPGRTEWEGFETATKAAAAGGITMLVDMPLNSSPVTTNLEAFRKKLAAAEGKLSIDCGFYAGVVPGNSSELPSLIEAGVLGAKAFLVDSGIDEFPNATEADLRKSMPILAEHGLPLLVHAELIRQPNPQSRIDNPKSYRSYLASRPRLWEHDAIELMIRLCREYKCRTHIVHLSSADEVESLKRARAEGLPLTIETCPQYLFFSAEEIPDGDTRFKCAPPIRERENCERLWTAAKEGVIDMIVSDHSPCPPEMKLMKEGDFQRAWGGIASLQFGLSIVWTEASKRGFSVADVAGWMSSQPSRLVGLDQRKGQLTPGFDADIVVWNPEAECRVSSDTTLHRHKVTPYEGRQLKGKVLKTFLRGIKVSEDGTAIDASAGRTILRAL